MRNLKPAFFLAVAMCLATHWRGLWAGENAAVWASLDGALRNGNPTAIQALTAAFSGQDRRIALTWVGQHLAVFSDLEVEDIYERFLVANPDVSESNGIREQLALSRLGRLPRETRVRLYWSALEKGAVFLTEGVQLTSTRALMRGAAEGLEEFADELQRRAEALDAVAVRPGVKTSELYLWSLQLGSGAKD